MVVWLDGRRTRARRPQENFGREIMELFTFGVGNYTEQDMSSCGARLHGLEICLVNGGERDRIYYEILFNADHHDATAKTFTFRIYSEANKHSGPFRG